jgi:hypothetical protein
MLPAQVAIVEADNKRLRSDNARKGRALVDLKAELEEAWREVDAERALVDELRRTNALLMADAERRAAEVERDAAEAACEAAVERLERAEASHKRARAVCDRK